MGMLPLFSNDNSFAMIDFMLNDLRRPTGEGLETHLKITVLVFNLNRLIPLSRTHPG